MDICNLHILQAHTRDKGPTGIRWRGLSGEAVTKLCQTETRDVDRTLFIWQSGTQVEAKEVELGMRQCLEASGKSPRGLSPHIFHIGVVSEAAKKGATEAQLRMMGRWRSNAYMRYVMPLSHRVVTARRHATTVQIATDSW